MSNETKFDHFSKASQNAPMRFRSVTAVRRATACILLCSLVIFGAGCDDDGRSGSASNSEPSGDQGVVAAEPEVPLETETVDLPPGQTEAVMAWEPSVGPVTDYLIFTSRNGSTFSFETNAAEPVASISGQAGDELRIVVVAVSENGTLSDASPPSAPVRFHPAAPTDAPTTEAVAALASHSPLASSTASSELTAGETDLVTSAALEIAGLEPLSPLEDGAALETGANTALRAEEGLEPQVTAEPDDEANRRFALLERLLSADARLASRGQSDEADAWVQSFVDEELATGVSFVGTGNANNDALRELVWQDSSGQLFISDGEAFLESEDGEAVETLEEALRLQATERFVAFEDFDGNTGAEWLIEDTLTGQVFIAEAEALSTREGTPLDQDDDDFRLLGLGDFDGDDQRDLIWMEVDGDGSLALGTEATGWVPNEDTEISVPEDRRADQILAIADLNGDGQDDLLCRDLDGRLGMAFLMRRETLEGIETFDAFWAGGADASTADLELVGTLDLDLDGEAEIAWIDGDAPENGLQIWDASEGLEGQAAF